MSLSAAAPIRPFQPVCLGGWRIFWSVLLAGLPCLGGGAETQKITAPDYYCRSWLVDDGLPHNNVNRVIQDSRGFLWLATVGGLARFDGINFKEFPLPPNLRGQGYNIRDLAEEDPTTLVLATTMGAVVRWTGSEFVPHPISPELAGAQAAKLFVTREHAVWVVRTDGKLMRWLGGKTEVFGSEDGIRASPRVTTLAEDTAGVTWIATDDYLGHYAAGKLVSYPTPPGQPMFIASGRAGAIWICTAQQLSKLENGHLTAVCSDLPWRDSFISVRAVFEDSQGTVWIGTSRRGLYRLTEGVVVPVPIPYSSIKVIAEDREGNLWIATDGFGLLRLRRKAFLLFNAETGLGENRSSAVCEDLQGDVWLANRSGHLARVRDGIAESVPFMYEGRAIYTNSVCPDRDGHLWFGGPAGIFRASLREVPELCKMSPTLTALRFLFCASNGDMWLRTYDGQFGYFRKDEYHEFPAVAGTPNARIEVNAMAEDGAGNLWAGGSSGDLLRIANGHTTVYTVKDGLPGMSIHALYADATGALWIGTSAGLVLKQGEQFRLFSEAAGLPDFLIMQILEDDHGQLWFGCRRGLFFVPKEELLALARGKAGPLRVRTFNKDEGLTGISPVVGSAPSAWKAHDGRLWFATLAGVVALDPAAVPVNRQPPPVFISEVYLDDEPVGAPAELRVPSGQHRVEFRFSALSFTAPEKVRLRHRLEGIDPGWVETNSNRSASYSSLPPGAHRLQVIACNDNGVWNELGATLALVVVPPWWQTPWAGAGALVLFTGLVTLTVRYWSQRKLQRRLQLLEYEHALQQERVRIARDLHDELGGSLTQIGLLAERIRQQPAPAELPGSLATLAGQARRITGELASIVWTISPKHNSLDQLAAFIRQYALRFFRDAPVVCTVSGVESIPPCPLAPEEQHHLLSVAKEAMNNVLRHSQAARLTIRMTVAHNVFELMFQDDGIGFDSTDTTSHEGNGINNMRARVAEIGGRLKIVSRANQGTQLTVCFPCAPASIPPEPKPAVTPTP